MVSPDTEFRYGGAQWQVAGGVAEAVTGQTWFQLFDTIYAEPCGLTASGFSHQLLFGASGNYPFGFDGDLERLRPTDNPFIEGGMYTTIDDYGRLLLMHLQGGVCGQTRVHPEETIERMHADRILQAYQGWTGQPSLGGYGMGWWVDRRREGWVSDPGAYGSYPYLDKARGIAVFTVLEMSIREGFELHRRIRPVVERAVDAQAAGAE